MKTESRVVVLATALSLIGLAGAMISSQHVPVYLFWHIGGLGSLGLLACLAGLITKKKGRKARTAFLVCFVSSIGLGVLSVCVVHALGGRGCGGVVSYGASLVVIGWYAVARRGAVESLQQ